ncbi:hypothetical protein [Streptomyces sp. OE57]|uniref:hypothetical protein n=1 Tax=Streptomyces lacaronensis TaxID=3379885 RepID=UPI0039B764BF
MTSSSPRGITAAAATVLTLTLAASGCGSDISGEGRARSSTPSPAATGTGPYPTPSASRTAAPESPSPRPTGTPRGGTPRPGDVEQTDADAVSRGALTALWTFDTAVDRGPHDAELRAVDAGWLTKAYADRLRSRQPQSVPGAQWQEWVRHRAYGTVELEQAEEAAKPTDTGTEAWRQWTVITTPSGRDQWTGQPVPVAAYVHLTRAAAGTAWRVADVIVR